MANFPVRPHKTLEAVSVAVVAIGLPLLLSGCLRIDADLTLHPDDTVSGSYIYAVSAETAEDLGFTGEGIAVQLGAGDVLDAYTSTTVTPFTDGSLEGLLIHFSAEPLATFDGSLPDGIVIRREGDLYVLEAPTLGEVSDADDATLADSEITLSVTFPGAVVEHNGTLTGTTVAWDLRASVDPPHARGHASGPAFPWVPFGIAGGVALLGASTLLLRRRSASGRGSPPPPR